MALTAHPSPHIPWHQRFTLWHCTRLNKSCSMWLFCHSVPFRFDGSLLPFRSWLLFLRSCVLLCFISSFCSFELLLSSSCLCSFTLVFSSFLCSFTFLFSNFLCSFLCGFTLLFGSLLCSFPSHGFRRNISELRKVSVVCREGETGGVVELLAVSLPVPTRRTQQVRTQ